MSANTESVQKFEFKAEMKQLLHIIIHSLYTHPEIFLRELISNASDALNKLRFRKLTDQNILDSKEDLTITIDVDPKKGIFSIEDTGIGMTKEELINNIGIIAKSGTIEFLQKMKDQQNAFDGDLIGKFGVGFYSVFMVADEVSVETRHADTDSKGYLWKSTGEGSYSIEEIKKKNRGTKIFFKLKESAKEFAQEFKVKEIINKYSNFAEFPIFFKKEKVNTVSALWHKKASEIKDNELDEFYKFITNDFEDPLGHLQFSLEGAVNFKALMFIPKTAPSDLFRFHAEKSLHLYSNKILIQHDCKELLPDHMRFMRGVVDTVDLPLNVSRETVQSSPVMSKIKDVLAGKILGFLKNWAENDVEKYVTFYRNFGAILKIGLNSDFTNRDKLVELMRYETSLKPKGELVSLKEYVSRMPESQKEIYYLSGDSREVLEKNPNLEYFNKHSLEVLLLSDPTDVFTFPSINNYEKKPIKSIDKADIDLKPEDAIEKPDNAVTKSLVALFKEALGDRVEDVVESKRLVESAVTLVSGKQSMDPQMEKMMRMMNKDYQKQKKIIEVNMTHPLIRNLTKKYIGNAQDPFIKKCMLQMYEGALFIDGELPPSADFVKRMTEIMEEASR